MLSDFLVYGVPAVMMGAGLCMVSRAVGLWSDDQGASAVLGMGGLAVFFAGLSILFFAMGCPQ